MSRRLSVWEARFTFANETEEDVEFVVFGLFLTAGDKRETIKSDKGGCGQVTGRRKIYG